MDETKNAVAGLFAGVGGIELGFQLAGFEPIVANEIDSYAALTYELNHDHELIVGDIKDFDASTLPPDLSVLAGGFPCQPFSVAGLRKGFDDDRGNVYWEIERLIRENRPRVVFLENVKNLVSHDGGNTFGTIRRSLEDLGYHVTYKVMNATEYGNVPQNRERIYILAFRDNLDFAKFAWPAPIPLTAKLSQFIDFDSKLDSKYYYDGARPFFEELSRAVVSRDTVYQWRRHYVRENKSGVCPTLTANMGMGGHNVPIVLTKHGIRKLTPRECFKLMGFGEIRLPSVLAESRLYKQAGNSVVVPVIRRIADQVRIALN